MNSTGCIHCSLSPGERPGPALTPAVGIESDKIEGPKNGPDHDWSRQFFDPEVLHQLFFVRFLEAGKL